MIKRKYINRIRKFLISLLLPVFILVIWELFFRFEVFPRTQLAPPSMVFPVISELIIEEAIIPFSFSSLRRLILGVLVGMVFGIFSGSIAARFKKVEILINPTIAFFAPIPVVVWIPFAILIFGVGEYFQISLVSLATFLLVHMYTFSATSSVRNEYSGIADIYGLSFLKRLRFLYLPRVLPEVLTALRVAVIIGWIVLFLVEFGSEIPSESGLAFFIKYQQSLGRIEDAFAGLILLALLAYLLDLLFISIRGRIDKRLLRTTRAF